MHKNFWISLIIIVVVGIILAFLIKNLPQDSAPVNEAPVTLNTKYISTVDWPPTEQILNVSFSCEGAGSEIEQAGITELQTINGKKYCVTRVTEGAAGSLYTQYAYMTELSGGRVSVKTFSLRFVQCDNYDEPQKSECKTERSNFSPNILIRD